MTRVVDSVRRTVGISPGRSVCRSRSDGRLKFRDDRQHAESWAASCCAMSLHLEDRGRRYQYYESSMEQQHPLENRTFCQEKGNGGTLSTGGGQHNQATGSTGS